MKRIFAVLFCAAFSSFSMQAQAQNPDDNSIRIKIDANVDGENCTYRYFPQHIERF